MTTYYIDPNLGSDSTGDGSEGNPFRTVYKGQAASAYGVGNTWLFKRGTVHGPVDAGFTGNPANEGQRVLYGAYGSGNPPVINAAGSAYGLRVQNKDFVTFEDFDIYDATNTGLQAINNVTRACSYLRANRVRAWRAGFDGVGLVNSVNSPGPAVGVVFDGCEGHDCGQHGVAITAYATGGVIRNAKASNNSLSSSGWGVYQGGHGLTYLGASGWTIAGNVKYRAEAVEPYSVITGNTVGGAYFLAKNTTTPTTPAVGEWGWSAGVLYINLGATVGDYSVAVIYQPNTGSVIERSVGWGHINAAYDMVGVGLDRGVVGGRIIACGGWDNGGSAVQVNQARDIVVAGCFGLNNRETVYMSTVAGQCKVLNCSGVETAYGLRVARLYTGDIVDLFNNVGDAPISVSCQTIAGTVTSDYNCLPGVLEGVSSGPHDITADPLLNPDGTLKPGSPCIGAGKTLDIPMLAYDGRPFSNPPSIGAREFRQNTNRAQRS